MDMNMIRPVSDLRNNFADISKTVHETEQPVFLTKNGYGDMVVMSMEAFEKMLDAVLSQYDSTTEKMARLKADGKEKTATYRQLFADKLQYQNMISYYRAYGLLEDGRE